VTQPTVLFDRDRISERIQVMGGEITTALAGKDICVVGLIKSCMVFMADLVRAIPLDMTCHYLRVSSQREGTGSMRTDIIYSTEIAWEGRHILLLDDVIDTGITLNFLLDHIREGRPASLRVAALIDKPGERKIDVHPDWAAFTLTDQTDSFLVGYGLDHAERYRGLPYIGTIPRPATPAAERTISITPVD
jgi:hypoxanthine phosphoribosyltransferase